MPSTPRQPTPPLTRGSPTAATPSKTFLTLAKTLLTLAKILLTLLQKGLTSRGSSLGGGRWPTKSWSRVVLRLITEVTVVRFLV